MGGYAAINAYKDELGIDFLILMSTPIERKGKFLNHQFNTKNGKITFEAIYKNIIIPTLFITGTEDSIVKSESTLNLLK